MPSAELKSMKKELKQVMEEARIMAFIQVVRRHGKANLVDVGELARELGLQDLNLGQLLFDDLPRSGKEWSRRTLALSAAKSSGAANDGLNLRTVKGREEYDAKVLGQLRKKRGWTAASDVRADTGGSPGQFRSSVNRLIESGKVEFQGRAAATKYKAVA